jgi:hypothetical protein
MWSSVPASMLSRRSQTQIRMQMKVLLLNNHRPHHDPVPFHATWNAYETQCARPLHTSPQVSCMLLPHPLCPARRRSIAAVLRARLLVCCRAICHPVPLPIPTKRHLRRSRNPRPRLPARPCTLEIYFILSRKSKESSAIPVWTEMLFMLPIAMPGLIPRQGPVSCFILFLSLYFFFIYSPRFCIWCYDFPVYILHQRVRRPDAHASACGICVR